MDINVEISDMRVALASLEAKATALETPKQWEPRSGDYWVCGWGDVFDAEPITRTSKFGVERQTAEAAKKASDAMRTHNRLLAYVDEFGGGWEADWEDKQQKKYYVYYSYHTLGWCMHHAYNSTIGGTVYMSQECAFRLINKLNSGEVVL